jgi:5-methylcytosine-specific restriction endonuclease McrA
VSKTDGKLNGSKWITRERRLAIYMRDEFTCLYCGRDLHGADPKEVTLDHLTCRTNGGGNETHNLVTACRSCNSARGSKSWHEYATGGARDRITLTVILPVNIALAKSIIAGKANVEVEAAR